MDSSEVGPFLPEHDANGHLEHTGREVAAGAESLSGGEVDAAHIGREIAPGAESLSGGHGHGGHIGREVADGAESLSGETSQAN